jgi:hypothetical protein
LTSVHATSDYDKIFRFFLNERKNEKIFVYFILEVELFCIQTPVGTLWMCLYRTKNSVRIEELRITNEDSEK